MTQRSTNDEKPSVEERYTAATNSRNLTLLNDRRTDADILLAAAYATAGDSRKMLALRFYRLRATGDMNPFRDLASISGEWLRSRSFRGGRKKLHSVESKDLAARTLFWWLNPSCPHCKGRGHPEMPGGHSINQAHNCEHCHGTGQTPINKIVPLGTADEARWLVDELNRFCGIVFSDMARLMAPTLTINIREEEVGDFNL